jgi:hypothetical protein
MFSINFPPRKYFQKNTYFEKDGEDSSWMKDEVHILGSTPPELH